MAATGSTPVSLYHTTTASAVPVNTNLIAGELALNTTDEKLYFKNTAGTVKLLASNAGASGDVTLAGVQTLTNKRVTPRVNAQTTTTSPWAWNSDSYDQQSFSALANPLTINADAGTPTDGQKTILRFEDNGTAQALTWTTGSANSFRTIGVVLPTTTTIGKTIYVGCIYNSFDSRWDVVAVAEEV